MVEFFFECVPHGLKGCRWVPQSWWRPRWRCSCRLTRPTHWKTPQMCIHVSGQHPRTKDSQKKTFPSSSSTDFQLLKQTTFPCFKETKNPECSCWQDSMAGLKRFLTSLFTNVSDCNSDQWPSANEWQAWRESPLSLRGFRPALSRLHPPSHRRPIHNAVYLTSQACRPKLQNKCLKPPNPELSKSDGYFLIQHLLYMK